MSKTVFTIDGAGFSGFLPTMLKGTVTKDAKVVPIQYPNKTGAGKVSAIDIGVANLDKAIASTALTSDDEMIVYAISMGSQVAYKWIREFGDESALVGRLSFVLLGNPERKYNGWCRVPKSPLGGVPDYGGVGVPEDQPYKIIDFVRQYDGVGDQPNADKPNVDAVINCLSGMFIHSDYFNVTLDDSKNVSITEQNITYMWSPTYPLPHPSVSSWWWIPPYMKSLDKKYRAKVEKSYSRPVKL